MSTDEHLVASAAHCTGGGIPVYPAFAARKAGHGNDRVWEAWKAMKPASHPSHSPWKSLRDSHIPTASTTIPISSNRQNQTLNRQLEPLLRKGLVTDVSGPRLTHVPVQLTGAGVVPSNAHIVGDL